MQAHTGICKKQAYDRIFGAVVYNFFKAPKAASPGMYENSQIISLHIHNLSFQESVHIVSDRALMKQPGFVCFANVHMTIEAYNSPAFKKDLEKAFLILPDGKPLAVANRWLYHKKQERVSGMDFMPAILERASYLSTKIFLYGSTETVLNKLVEQITLRYPGVTVAGAVSPPFRALTETERDAYIRQINESGAHFVLVALGCPKQEKWMSENYTSINAVLLGLGGAFPVMAGVQKRSPVWMQRLALEWLFRLIQEPRRMFKRYLYTNTLFIGLLLKELIKQKLKGTKINKKSYQS
jgi:N-acetylglucosaminyldiphosphoundecaprenol N-acetyl-beta-D-mannosaminyltransferase